MGYFLKTFVGLGVMVAAIASCSYAVAELLQVGTCASGGPYVSARQCPPGTERLIIAFFPAIILMLAGAGVYAKRGAPPGSDRKGDGSVGFLIIWSGLFLGIAFASFWGVWGPEANPGPGGKLGGLIVGFLFVPMGLFPLLAVLGSLRGGRKGESAVDAGTMGTAGNAMAAMRAMGGTIAQTGWGSERAGAGAAAAGAADKLARLERLNKLRRDGALSDAEFERLKAEIVDG